jgi:hypothetical protein
MQRIVEREWLDELAASDPRAIRSRRDLRRINAWMGNARILTRALRDSFQTRAPQEVVELGAGDGEFMLSVARRLMPQWKKVNVTLLDRQDCFNEATARFEESGWGARTVMADAFEWLEKPAVRLPEVTVANLFLHHFSEAQLIGLFRAAAKTTAVLVAVEPRRSALSLAFSRMLWVLGCNAITRHDAVVSVRAGFHGNELSALWPGNDRWQLVERPAGLFSHLFIARRKC